MWIGALILICFAVLHCEGTYFAGGYRNPGYAGLGARSYAHDTPGLQYNALGLGRSPYSFPLDVDNYGSYYGGYSGIVDPGLSPGYAKGLYNANPYGYLYGSNLDYYGNYGFPLKKR